jgi:hypothetical protein
VTILSTPTVYDQLSAPSNTHWDDCGETCVASVLADALSNPAITPTQVVNAAWAKGQMNGSGTTTGPQLVSELADWGVLASSVQGSALVNAAAAISRRHRYIAMVTCNDQGMITPHTGIAHWVEVYGLSGSTFYLMNPLPGQLQQIVLGASDLDQGIEIGVIVPADRVGAPAPPPSSSSRTGLLVGGLMFLAGGAAIAGYELQRHPGAKAGLLRPVRRFEGRMAHPTIRR